jgi:hypothetical protein
MGLMIPCEERRGVVNMRTVQFVCGDAQSCEEQTHRLAIPANFKSRMERSICAIAADVQGEEIDRKSGRSTPEALT